MISVIEKTMINVALFFIVDIFNSKQLYVMFAFENSGCALEAFTVNTIIYYITSRIFLYKFETWPPSLCSC